MNKIILFNVAYITDFWKNDYHGQELGFLSIAEFNKILCQEIWDPLITTINSSLNGRKIVYNSAMII